MSFVIPRKQFRQIFDPEQVRIGALHELEHTSNRALAEQIAKDHLVEDPNYYRKLARAGLGADPIDAAAIPYVRVYREPPTIWTHLDRLGTIASALTGLGVIYAIWRKAK